MRNIFKLKRKTKKTSKKWTTFKEMFLHYYGHLFPKTQ